MQRKDFDFKIVKRSQSDIIVLCWNISTGATGRFRFNKSLNSTILTVYFEGAEKPKVHATVQRMTDLCLYVERNAEWIYHTIQ